MLQAQLKLAATNALTEGAYVDRVFYFARLSISEKPAVPTKDLKRKRDEFELPDGSLPQDSALDPRLVSDAELRDFISEHRHELNLSTDRIDSTAFKNLPIEVQHEIILDLKAQSRQPSQKRLANMVKESDSALAFSQHQIKHLVERNYLTERSFEVAKMSTVSSNPRLSRLNETGFVGAVQRVAGQRNRQFALLKGDGGGYTMAVQAKTTNQEETSPMDSSEVVDLSSDSDDNEIFQVVEKIQSRNTASQPQPLEEEDLTIMSSPSIASEDLPLSQAAFSTKSHPKTPSSESKPIVLDEDISVEELAVNTGAWIADEESVESIMARFKELEQTGPHTPPVQPLSAPTQPLAEVLDAAVPRTLSDDDSEIVVKRNRFDHTEEAFLELWMTTIPQVEETIDIPDIQDTMTRAMAQWTPDQVSEELARTIKRRGKCVPGKPREIIFAFLESYLKDLIEYKANLITPHVDATYQSDLTGDAETTVEKSATTTSEQDTITTPGTPEPMALADNPSPDIPTTKFAIDPRIKSPIHTHSLSLASSIQSTLAHLSPTRFSKSMPWDTISCDDTNRRGILAFADLPDEAIEPTNGELKDTLPNVADGIKTSVHANKETPDQVLGPTARLEKVANQVDRESPVLNEETIDLTLDEDDQGEDVNLSKELSSEKKEDLDLMFGDLTDVPLNFAEEEQEYARFVSQFGQDPQATTQQLSSEMETLRLKKRQEMRDASDVTTAMITETQELLRLFGLPFIVAPTEAESQCAFLATSGLTNGIVTDDSDVFLFGGTQVYRHFFNQQKFCETFSMSEMESRMFLERDRLIRMAYLVGSDYCPGIQGIGPVRALEVLREWDVPGLEGLKAFKSWVTNVQKRIFDESDTPMKKKMASLGDGANAIEKDGI